MLRRTPRNQALFGPPGNWYVYLSYGVHWCANLVCEGDGSGAAVLIRALEPVEGITVMRRRRKVGTDRGLCSGPGKLCQALAITRRLDGKQMTQAEVTVLRDQRVKPANVLVTPRVGITKAADWPLRFVVASSPWVSR
jgi:DNA-3-methyladenine glycosylase